MPDDLFEIVPKPGGVGPGFDPVKTVSFVNHGQQRGFGRQGLKASGKGGHGMPSGRSYRVAAVQATAEESRPPERVEPTGTSALSLSRTASRKTSLNSSINPASRPRERVGCSAQ